MLRKENMWHAIRCMCLLCAEGYDKIVRLCEDKECPLWYYRMGRPPKPEEVE